MRGQRELAGTASALASLDSRRMNGGGKQRLCGAAGVVGEVGRCRARS